MNAAGQAIRVHITRVNSSLTRGIIRPLGRVVVVLAILVVPLACGFAWLGRDPVPFITKRRSALVSESSEVIGSDSAHVNERVTLTAASGMRVEMIVRRPSESVANDSASEVKRPLFVILGGYRSGDRAATMIPNTHGNIVAALSYNFDGNAISGGLSVLSALPAIRRGILETPAAIMLALDYLLTRSDVDTSQVELIGASFGTAFACIVGALDERVTRVWSVHGAARPYDQIELNLRDNIPFTPARRLVSYLAYVVASGRSFDPEIWAPQITPRQFVMINAKEDERMPRDAIVALFEAAQEPKELIWLDGPHVRTDRPDVLRSLWEAVLARAN